MQRGVQSEVVVWQKGVSLLDQTRVSLSIAISDETSDPVFSCSTLKAPGSQVANDALFHLTHRQHSEEFKPSELTGVMFYILQLENRVL